MRTVGSNREETSRRVYDAAIQLFASKGFAATGIRELAEAAGLTSAALYHYMGTKDDLLIDIMRSTIEPLIKAGRMILDEGEEPEIQLARLVEIHVWLHGARPLATTISDSEVRALCEGRRREIMKLRDSYDAIWRKIISAGVKAGRFDVLDERIARLAVLEMATGVSEWYTPRGRLTLDELCSQHADLAFGILRARRGRRPLRRADLDLPPASEWFAEHGTGEDLVAASNGR